MGALRFTVITPACVRIEYSPSGPAGMVGAPTMLAAYRAGTPGRRVVHPVMVDDRDGGDPLVISTERFELRSTPRGRGIDAGSLEITVRGPFAPEHESSLGHVWRPGDRQTANLGGTLSTLDMLRGPVPLPDGLISRDGWYLIDDSEGHLLVDGWARLRDAAPGSVDWYFFAYGLDYPAAMRAFTAVSGPVPVPRRCMLGSWYSRYWPHTSDDYRQIVEDYARQQLPLDVVVLDMDWHRAGWTGWSWNRELIPDAEDLLKWLHGRGLAVTLNLHPADGVGPHEDRYGDFMRALGRDPASGETIPFDAGDRAYMRALLDHVHAPLEEDGVDFWWLDWQQDRFVRSLPGLTNLQWLNTLYFEHTARAGRPGASFSRWAGDSKENRWGDHRHPIHFSGDAHTGWDMLAFQVPFTAAAGNVGCFFWSHDIGGHFGPRNEEATTRWVQFGALSAALRLHSARTEALDRRPWTYRERFFTAMRSAFQLRFRLMDHLYAEAAACCGASIPFIRSMYWDWPGEPHAYSCPQQYMLGRGLLAAPIVAPGLGERCVATTPVWFPPGEGAWVRHATGERFAGGDEAIVSAEIDEIPVFAREDAPLPVPGFGTDPGAAPEAAHRARRFHAAFGPVGNQTVGTDGYGVSALRAYVVQRAVAASRLEAASMLAVGLGIGLWPGARPRLVDTYGSIDPPAAAVRIIDSIGARRDEQLSGTITLAGSGRSRAGEFGLPASPLAAPGLGLRAERSAVLGVRVDGKDVVFQHTLSSRLSPVPAGAWRVIGPFPWDWSSPMDRQVFSPEENGGRGLRAADWHDAGVEGWTGWRPAAAGEAASAKFFVWPVDLARSLGRDAGLGYATTHLISSRRQSVRLVVDCADKADVWVNGRRVVSQDVHNSSAPPTGAADASVMLPQGRSALLVKCSSGGPIAGWGFSLAVDGEQEINADDGEGWSDPGGKGAAPAPTPRFG